MGSLSDTVYQRSPVWAQNVGVAIWGLWWYQRRFGKHFKSALGPILERDRWSKEQFRRYQEQRLGEILEAAWRSPHYQRTFQAAGMKRGDAPFDALQKAPILSKQELRSHGRDLLTEKLGRDVMVFRSSGTTGTPTELFFKRDFHQLVQAYFEVRTRNWGGVTYRDRRVMFGVRKVCREAQTRPPFWRHSPAENLAYCSIYHLSPKLMRHYVDFLHEFRPKVVMGYPNSLVTLARFINESGLTVPAAKAIITTSETVTDEIRKSLETAFGCPVFDNYCAVEACMLGSQCEHGGYHISPDFGVYEIIDEHGKPCGPGQLGKAVCTGLNNFTQPLIRYAIGDAVAWAEDQSCPCGRSMPLIRSIEGRVEDMCYTRDGRAILRFDTVFKGVSTIREGQVIQETTDRFVIKVVPGPGYGEKDRVRLLENMKLHVGQVETEVVTVSEIARTSAGKFRPVISHVRPTLSA